jgi:hypothetical protein
MTITLNRATSKTKIKASEYNENMDDIESAINSGGAKASKAEVLAGTNDTKFATPLAMAELLKPEEGKMYNGRILPSVASNNLTVALKTLAGTDPSATDPVYVMIGGVVRSITSAITATLNAGTNWFNLGSAELATKETDLFVYIGYQDANSAVRIGLSRVPYYTNYTDTPGYDAKTNEKCMTINSNINGANPGNSFNVIGRFAATLSAGAGYTWSVPTFTASNLIQRPIYETRPSSYVSTGAVANCTGTGGYQIIGKRITGWMHLVLSGAPAFDSSHMPKLPFAASSNEFNGDNSSCGIGGYEDSGTSNKPNSLSINVGPYLFVNNGAILSNTNPITWTNQDKIDMHFDYEI